MNDLKNNYDYKKCIIVIITMTSYGPWEIQHSIKTYLIKKS